MFCKIGLDFLLECSILLTNRSTSSLLIIYRKQTGESCGSTRQVGSFGAVAKEVVPGRIGNETVISEDDRVAAEAVTYAASLLSDGDSENDELAKTICDLINNGQMIQSGVIPESPERYKSATAGGMPILYSLEQNYPNPFNPVTEISYMLPTACHVELCVYNLLGQRIKLLVNDYQTAGQKTVSWDGSDDHGNSVASGVYFYRLIIGESEDTKKMILMK